MDSMFIFGGLPASLSRVISFNHWCKNFLLFRMHSPRSYQLINCMVKYWRKYSTFLCSCGPDISFTLFLWLIIAVYDFKKKDITDNIMKSWAPQLGNVHCHTSNNNLVYSQMLGSIMKKYIPCYFWSIIRATVTTAAVSRRWCKWEFMCSGYRKKWTPPNRCARSRVDNSPQKLSSLSSSSAADTLVIKLKCVGASLKKHAQWIDRNVIVITPILRPCKSV